MIEQNLKKIWFTSDLHFGHKNIIRFCDRPFREYGSLDEQRLNYATDSQVIEMNESILDNINNKVSQDDELWVLGDIAMGNIDHTLKLMERITCRNIIVVAGNHDRCHPVNGDKHKKWIDRYRNLKNITQLYLTNTTFTFPNTDITVQVSHFPYGAWEDSHPRNTSGLETRKDKYEPWRPIDDGEKWLLCGHVHEKWRQKDRQINVGIDAWGGNPVNAEELLSLINEGSHDLPRILWVK